MWTVYVRGLSDGAIERDNGRGTLMGAIDARVNSDGDI